MSIQSKVQQITGLAMDISESGIADVTLHLHGELGILDVFASQADAVVMTKYLYTKSEAFKTEQQINIELDAVIAQLNELKAQKELTA
ncbi:MAG: hypothetical protein V7731_24150 [Amphritea sp.]